MNIKEGDEVNRMLGSEIMMVLTITKVDHYIHCGPWRFHTTTGGEIDEELGWDGVNKTGTYIRLK